MDMHCTQKECEDRKHASLTLQDYSLSKKHEWSGPQHTAASHDCRASLVSAYHAFLCCSGSSNVPQSRRISIKPSWPFVAACPSGLALPQRAAFQLVHTNGAVDGGVLAANCRHERSTGGSRYAGGSAARCIPQMTLAKALGSTRTASLLPFLPPCPSTSFKPISHVPLLL